MVVNWTDCPTAEPLCMGEEPVILQEGDILLVEAVILPVVVVVLWEAAIPLEVEEVEELEAGTLPVLAVATVEAVPSGAVILLEEEVTLPAVVATEEVEDQPTSLLPPVPRFCLLYQRGPLSIHPWTTFLLNLPRTYHPLRSIPSLHLRMNLLSVL
jgi:hypothetical protein